MGYNKDMQGTKTIVGVIAAVLAAAVFGFLTYGLMSSRSIQSDTLTQLQNLQAIYSSSGVMNYGVVTAVDAKSGMLSVKSADPYLPGQSISYNLVVPNTAIITEQSVSKQGDVFNAVSSGPGTLSAISVGTRVKYAVEQRKGTLLVTMLLYGNPL